MPQARRLHDLRHIFIEFDPPFVTYVVIVGNICVALPHLSRQRNIRPRLPICHLGWRIRLRQPQKDDMGLPFGPDIHHMWKAWNCESTVPHVVPVCFIAESHVRHRLQTLRACKSKKRKLTVHKKLNTFFLATTDLTTCIPGWRLLS